MNKLLLSTIKVVVLLTASTFFAYMILKAQIKSSSKRAKALPTSNQPNVESEEEKDMTEPVLTYVASTKAEVSAIEVGFNDVEVTYTPSKFVAQADKKKYIELESDTLDENGKQKELFHSSKAVLTTVAIENLETNDDVKELPKDDIYFPASKAAPVDFDLKTEGEILTKAEDLQVRIFELEYQVKKLKAQITELKKFRK